MVARGRSVSVRADELTRKVALAALSTVSTETPVDTGRARSNWIVALGAPRREVIDSYGPDQGAAGAISAGEAVIAGYRGEGQAIYISNNLPYISRLNDGWSAQAPAGFVETAVRAAVLALGNGTLVLDRVSG